MQDEATLRRVDHLDDGEFLLWQDCDDDGNDYGHPAVCVRCSKVDKVHVHFQCPFCWTKYKKNGQPTARARRRVHFHGSGGSCEQGCHGSREPHCYRHGKIEPFPYEYGGFMLFVTERTRGNVPATDA